MRIRVAAGSEPTSTRHPRNPWRRRHEESPTSTKIRSTKVRQKQPQEENVLDEFWSTKMRCPLFRPLQNGKRRITKNYAFVSFKLFFLSKLLTLYIVLKKIIDLWIPLCLSPSSKILGCSSMCMKIVNLLNELFFDIDWQIATAMGNYMNFLIVQISESKLFYFEINEPIQREFAYFKRNMVTDLVYAIWVHHIFFSQRKFSDQK